MALITYGIEFLSTIVSIVRSKVLQSKFTYPDHSRWSNKEFWVLCPTFIYLSDGLWTVYIEKATDTNIS